MTEEDIALYFPLPSGEDPQDFYDETLFTYKQFFTNKVPITKVFGRKLEALKKFHQAYLKYQGMEEVSYADDELNSEVSVFENMKAVFAHFQRSFSEVRLRISMAQNAVELANAVKQMMNVYEQYALSWPEIENSELNVKIGQQPDAMEMLNAIDLFVAQGKGFEDVYLQAWDSLIYQEAIRLSLWKKMEADV